MSNPTETAAPRKRRFKNLTDERRMTMTQKAVATVRTPDGLTATNIRVRIPDELYAALMAMDSSTRGEILASAIRSAQAQQI